MPLPSKIGGGKRSPQQAGLELKDKLNEILDYLGERERARLTPSNCGILKSTGDIDITELERRVHNLEST